VRSKEAENPPSEYEEGPESVKNVVSRPPKFRAGEEKGSKVAMAEWLRRQTRNLLGSPAQVRILLATFLLLGR
jgi:hypothetical protein